VIARLRVRRSGVGDRFSLLGIAQAGPDQLYDARGAKARMQVAERSSRAPLGPVASTAAAATTGIGLVRPNVADLLSLDPEIVEMSGGHGFGLGRAFWGLAGSERRGHHGRAGDDEAEGDDPADDG
jgi:hypothetical protein